MSLPLALLALATFSSTCSGRPAPLSPSALASPPAAPSAAERAALLDLFLSSGGSAWRRNDGWNNSASHCSWFGVECSNKTGRITSFSLYDNLLSGTIPASMGVLKDVEYFALSTNKLSGVLPPFRFPVNRYFDVRYNKLVGDVNITMPSLTHLVVSDNMFTGGLAGIWGSAPSALPRSTMDSLAYVDLSANQLVSDAVPTSLCTLENLTFCRLATKYRTNHFTEIPPCVAKKCDLG